MLSALRRAGLNPTESEVQDMTNQIDDGSSTLNSEDFCLLVMEKNKEIDTETLFKDTFRVFSKDNEGYTFERNFCTNVLLKCQLGCIPALEMKFVLQHLPNGISFEEINEMIDTVDKNGDGKISFSEFRFL